MPTAIPVAMHFAIAMHTTFENSKQLGFKKEKTTLSYDQARRAAENARRDATTRF